MRYLLAMFGLVTLSGTAAGAVISLAPLIDGQIKQNTGFATSVTTTNAQLFSRRSSFTVGGFPGSSSQTVDSFAMEFDLASIPLGSTITSALLFFSEVSDQTTPNEDQTLRGYIGDGSMSTQDILTGQVLVNDVANGSVQSSVSFDVTGYVASAVTQSQYVGFRVTASGGTRQPSSAQIVDITTLTYRIHSRLASSPSQQPYLLIQTVPEAGSFVLLAVGSVGILIFCCCKERTRFS